jgi:hypothetical protein
MPIWAVTILVRWLAGLASLPEFTSETLSIIFDDGKVRQLVVPAPPHKITPV